MNVNSGGQTVVSFCYRRGQSPNGVTQKLIERFLYDLQMKTREQNRNNKRTEVERFDWFIERMQTRVAFDWLNERSGEKTSCPKNFLEINRYFSLTSYCGRIHWPIEHCLLHIRVSLAGKGRGYVFNFSSIG